MTYKSWTRSISKEKGPKHFPGAQFSVSFSQLLAVKKTLTLKLFGPSYFVTALETHNDKMCAVISTVSTQNFPDTPQFIRPIIWDMFEKESLSPVHCPCC